MCINLPNIGRNNVLIIWVNIISLSSPPVESDIDPQELVDDNAHLILKKWRKYEGYREQAPSRKFEPGEVFPYRGDNLPIEITHVDF